MADRSVTTSSATIESAMKQNPLLYLLIVLVLGGNGLDMFSSSGLREEVSRIADSVRDLSVRLDAGDRVSADMRHQLDNIQSDLEDLESRVRQLERQGLVP
jgi:hypothetical protein